MAHGEPQLQAMMTGKAGKKVLIEQKSLDVMDFAIAGTTPDD